MPAAEGAFVALAAYLRPPPDDVPAPLPEPVVVAPAPAPDAELLRDVRLFRARLADAFDAARATLLCEFAAAVLGRELLLAPCDLARIATRLLDDHPAAGPLRMRVAPSDLAELSARATALPPLVPDVSLAPGDAVLDFAAGPLDARLGVRLVALLEAAQ